MNGPWIKMRPSLVRDPKVLRMSEWLVDQRDYIDWVLDKDATSKMFESLEEVTPRHVTVALLVTGLLVTWGVAYERGERDGDDLLLKCCGPRELNTIVGVPLFAQALESVGWVVFLEKAAKFPNFFAWGESPDDKLKRQAAERQARRRDKLRHDSNVTSNVTGNVTITPRIEETRVEKKRTHTQNDPGVCDDVFQLLLKASIGESDARRIAANGCTADRVTGWVRWMDDQYGHHAIANKPAYLLTCLDAGSDPPELQERHMWEPAIEQKSETAKRYETLHRQAEEQEREIKEGFNAKPPTQDTREKIRAMAEKLGAKPAQLEARGKKV